MERVEDDVAFGLENRRWAPTDMRRRVPEALGEVGLGGYERRRPNRLSGGEQQRLALAGVLAPRPEILVLDEPTANLDPPAASAFFARLAALRETRSTTIVLVEHRVDAAWPLADAVLALGSDGRPIDLGAPDLVLARSGAAMRAAGIWLPGERVRAARRRPPTVGNLIGEARDVWFGYDRERTAVRGGSLAVKEGERIALTGPNGSGKSTLGRLLVGLLKPQAGTVRLGQRDPARLPASELARMAGYVFQDPERQFLTGTVGDEVRLGLRGEEHAGVDDLMRHLSLPLEQFADRSPYLLSGGEQRRLSLACVLVRRPALLVLDEPTFGQDRRGYDGLLAILEERVGEGTAILAATHDERFVGEVAARRVAMESGRIVSDERLAATEVA
jgi:energy-coupling factor transport system ATP-binding protein